MTLIRQLHSEFFATENEAQECIDWYIAEGDPMISPSIEGPDEKGRYSIAHTVDL